MAEQDVDTPAALFEPSGPDGWMATELARGPWDPRHCHGGPVGALLARAVEHADHTAETGANDTASAATAWQIARLTVELTRPVPAADYGSGVSRGLDAERFLFINPDLTVHLVREPVGEWIGMRAASYYGIDDRSAGAGMADSALYDARGRLGRSVQSLFIDQR